jgi:hypothetical protein
MPRPCSICAHPNRAVIDAALESGQSLRAVARQFAVSKSSVERHQKHGHTPTPLTPAAAPVVSLLQSHTALVQASPPQLSPGAAQALQAYRTSVQEYEERRQIDRGWMPMDRSPVLVPLWQKVQAARQRLAQLGVTPEVPQ